MSDFYFPNTPDYTDPHKYDYLNEEAAYSALADRLMISWNTPLFLAITDCRCDGWYRAVTTTLVDTTRPWISGNSQTVSRIIFDASDFSSEDLDLIGDFSII